jgi:hypothetical protein
VPVAAEGETVAVSVTSEPTVAVVGEAVRVVLEDVVPPVESVAYGFCQKSPQPASASAAAHVASSEAFATREFPASILRNRSWERGARKDIRI